VLTNIPGSKKVSEVSSEATYLLPKVSSEKFPEFFKNLDLKIKSLRISSYGVSMTTLEEVFLKVETGGKEDKKDIETLKRRMTSEVNHQEEYSMAKEQVEGVFSVFFLHFYALIVKRFILSKRNFKGFLMDILVPSLLIIAGLGLATVDFYKNSSQRILEPSLFPLDQRVIYNTNNGGGGAAADLIAMLEPASDFSASSITTTGTTELTKLTNFDEQIYDASLVDPISPSRFGHYYFNHLDYTNHHYQVATLFNTTSQDAHVAFPHFIYQAILKKSIGSSFNYTMINDPMPIVKIYEEQEKGGNALFLSFVMGIGFALIPTSIIGFLLQER
jgi:hypothetical protein